MKSPDPIRGVCPKVVAVVGLCGTGKSEVVRLFAELAEFKTIHFGGAVLDEIRRRGLAVTEESESLVRVELRAKFGMAAMAVLRMDEIKAALEIPFNVMIDGLYSYSELRLLQASLTSGPTTVAVHSRRDLRVSRLATRRYRPLSEQEMDAREIGRAHV